jgi:hypothetical protein
VSETAIQGMDAVGAGRRRAELRRFADVSAL